MVGTAPSLQVATVSLRRSKRKRNWKLARNTLACSTKRGSVATATNANGRMTKMSVVLYV